MNSENGFSGSDSGAQQRVQKWIVNNRLPEMFPDAKDEEIKEDFELENGAELDARVDLEVPVFIEIWAHLGKPKGAQKDKPLKDACRLKLAERELGKECEKLFVVINREAIGFLDGSWRGEIVEMFDVAPVVCDVPEQLKQAIRDAQDNQDLTDLD